MNQWKANSALANNSVNWAAASFGQGSGAAAHASNNTALFVNVGIGVWKGKGGSTLNQVVGQFPVSPKQMANTAGENNKVRAPGWHMRREGVGPLTSVTAANGSGFANGESARVSGGFGVNGTVILTANTTGNLVSASISNGGLFPNTSLAVFTFTREKHVTTATSTGGLSYTNTDTFTLTGGLATGTGTVATNATGGSLTLTVTNGGLFGPAQVAANVVTTFFAANGAASAGSAATITPVLATSTGGSLTAATVGGRAGRVNYECLVEMSSIAVANTTILPS